MYKKECKHFITLKVISRFFVFIQDVFLLGDVADVKIRRLNGAVAERGRSPRWRKVLTALYMCCAELLKTKRNKEVIICINNSFLYFLQKLQWEYRKMPHDAA